MGDEFFLIKQVNILMNAIKESTEGKESEEGCRVGSPSPMAQDQEKALQGST